MTRTIKRYSNRKLYDLERSVYVNLGDIAQLIRENENVVVIDNVTKQDITSWILTQIILESEKRRHETISTIDELESLRHVIRSGDGSISGFMSAEAK